MRPTGQASAPDDLFGPPADDAGAEPTRGPRPLADRLRPRTLDEVVGQDHLLGPEGTLTRMLARGSLASLILWGPPGTGKTTIARLLAARSGLAFVQLSAVFSGVADLKRAFEDAARRRRAGQGTLLFVDEIHRFNRAQQDGFLPVVEDGTVTAGRRHHREPVLRAERRAAVALPGAGAAPAGRRALGPLLDPGRGRAGPPSAADAGGPRRAARHGGWRRALHPQHGGADRRAAPDTPPLDAGALAALLARRAALYDKDREEHYNLISALHKSLRGSDPDAALYWFARMLTGGEDPRYIARRLVRFAAEDIGMADPAALPQALAGWETYERLGSPEGELALAQVVVYLGTAPKSNAVYTALGAARRAAKATGSLMPPAHILNAPTKLMQELGYGTGYAYDHQAEDAFSGQNYFPDGMARKCSTRRATAGSSARSASGSRCGRSCGQSGAGRGATNRRDDGYVGDHRRAVGQFRPHRADGVPGEGRALHADRRAPERAGGRGDPPVPQGAVRAPRRPGAVREPRDLHLYRPGVRGSAAGAARSGRRGGDRTVDRAGADDDRPGARPELYRCVYECAGRGAGARDGRGVAAEDAGVSSTCWRGVFAARPYLAGEAFSLADMFLFPLIWFMRLKPESAAMLQASPHLVEWYDRVAARPSAVETEPPAA